LKLNDKKGYRWINGQSKWNHAASLEKYQYWHTGGTDSHGEYA